VTIIKATAAMSVTMIAEMYLTNNGFARYIRSMMMLTESDIGSRQVKAIKKANAAVIPVIICFLNSRWNAFTDFFATLGIRFGMPN